MISGLHYQLAAQLGERLRNAGWRVCCAESCTGGMLAQAITAVPGSSLWFEMSWVCYADRAKLELLEVPEDRLRQWGAVSEAVVLAMAEGAMRQADADLALAVSGIAGPDGAVQHKPVGTVWLGWAACGLRSRARRFQFRGDRGAVRQAATEEALRGALRMLDERDRQQAAWSDDRQLQQA